MTADLFERLAARATGAEPVGTVAAPRPPARFAPDPVPGTADQGGPTSTPGAGATRGAAEGAPRPIAGRPSTETSTPRRGLGDDRRATRDVRGAGPTAAAPGDAPTAATAAAVPALDPATPAGAVAPEVATSRQDSGGDARSRRSAVAPTVPPGTAAPTAAPAVLSDDDAAPRVVASPVLPQLPTAASHQGLASRPASRTGPATVTVHIGRVDVRATVTAPTAPAVLPGATSAPDRPPVLGLRAYLDGERTPS